MNEKIFFIFIFCVFLFAGCRSTNIPSDGGATTEARSDLSELQSKQSDSAATAERIQGASTILEEAVRELTAAGAELEERITAAEGTASEREDLDTEFEWLLEQIRSQELPAATGEPGTAPESDTAGRENRETESWPGGNDSSANPCPCGHGCRNFYKV